MVLEPGILAKSKAGRDKDCIYVIISVNDEYVYLADGKKRTISQAKKKNRKHIQPIGKVHCGSVTDNEEIKRVIKQYIKGYADVDESKQNVQKARED